MKQFLVVVVCAGGLAACSTNAKSPDVTETIRHSLDQSGFKNVSVRQDRAKGVVTLSGHVPSDADRTQAEKLAKDVAKDDVVADEIIVTPPGVESDAKEISESLDSGIESNLKAAFLAKGISSDVKYRVKAGSVTLTGTVDSAVTRAEAATVASKVPYVKEVINELTIKK